MQGLNAKPTLFFDESVPGTGQDSLESLSVPRCLMSRDKGPRTVWSENQVAKFELQLIEDKSVGLCPSWFQSVHSSQLSRMSFTR